MTEGASSSAELESGPPPLPGSSTPPHRRRQAGERREAVFAEAQKLLTARRRPTVALIRQAIGGSPNDIAPLLKEWRESSGETLGSDSSALARAFPETPDFVRYARELWACAVARAKHELRVEAPELHAAHLEGENGALHEQLLFLEKQLADLRQVNLQDKLLVAQYQAREKLIAAQLSKLTTEFESLQSAHAAALARNEEQTKRSSRPRKVRTARTAIVTRKIASKTRPPRLKKTAANSTQKKKRRGKR